MAGSCSPGAFSRARVPGHLGHLVGVRAARTSAGAADARGGMKGKGLCHCHCSRLPRVRWDRGGSRPAVGAGLPPCLCPARWRCQKISRGVEKAEELPQSVLGAS